MADYNTLVSDTSSFVENTSPEFVAEVPTFISNAETRLYRLMAIPGLEYQDTGALSSSSLYFSRPADLVTLRYMTIQSSNAYSTLILVQLGTGFTWYPTLTDMGMPRFYAVYDANNYRLFPAPDQNYPFNRAYKRRLAPLSATNPTNVLTSQYYDVLLAATLCEASRYVLDDRQEGLIKIWEANLAAALQAANAVEDVDNSSDDYKIPYALPGRPG